jgi:hypothetical protein
MVLQLIALSSSAEKISCWDQNLWIGRNILFCYFYLSTSYFLQWQDQMAIFFFHFLCTVLLLKLRCLLQML